MTPEEMAADLIIAKEQWLKTSKDADYRRYRQLYVNLLIKCNFEEVQRLLTEAREVYAIMTGGAPKSPSSHPLSRS